MERHYAADQQIRDMVSGRVLVIAGSDSSGGAGLEADQKNTLGVYDIHEVPPDFLRKQIDACLDDIGVDVVKTGMLASEATIIAVSKALKDHNVAKLVVDPVMPSTTSHREMPLQTVADLERLARALQTLGPEWVLVKGGHCPFQSDGTVATAAAEKQLVVDVLYGNGQAFTIETPYHHSRNTHGTGCSLASAIASNLAKGLDVPQATKRACRYVEAGIRMAHGLGKGNGPLHHFHSTYTLPFSPDRFVEYLLERPEVAPLWDRYVYHPFVLAMGDGTLPLESFKEYLTQDYIYLTHFARANALAAYKAKNMEDTAAAASIVTHIFNEMSLHISYCQEFGLSKEDMEQTEESEACTAYTRYVLDIGQSQDWMGLQIALAPCLLGYGAVAKHLYSDPRSKREGNTYWTWIENYVAEDYVAAVRTGSGLLEKHAVQQSPARIEELVKVFVHATKMEIAFWEMYSFQ
ncbi:hypothetical protein P8C59_006682 [Phyllachora maydis]|uniref:Phosphomethylpyrimidine kinase n=1 Tax=Phyllachora maydis TaxID=1825666 RepID=A0AAD9I6Y5_9PEZI|nr:hypothetical protein P8C59_006682 [Phyllachora maydis]